MHRIHATLAASAFALVAMAGTTAVPAQAQTWNMYQNPATNSFFIPCVTSRRS